nr:ABC transporter substrate-binding protein [Treponemataceae bacterium]
MKNTLKLALLAALSISLLFTGCKKSAKADSSKTEGKVKIGIAKILQHVALDAVEQGVIDAINDAGYDAEFDLQNANGDVNTANQIASQFRDENVDVAVGIATPIAIALANTIGVSFIVLARA